MTALRKTLRKYTLEEYAEFEKNSEEKLEFYDGDVWSMAGASPNHETIVVNLSAELRSNLRGRGCRVFSSNLKVKVPIYPPYRYPDVTALVNPSLIVEVLSPSTESFDLTDKFTYYKSIETFTEYLLISQDRPHIVLYTKQDEQVWLHREYNDLSATVYLSSLDCEISLAEIYLDIEFQETNRPRFPFEP